MEQERAFSLLNRQLIDIIANAERIENGNDSPEEVEAFARYSNELKRFVNERIEDETLRKVSLQIPNINYQRNQIHLWQYLILPAWWISLYLDYQTRKTLKEEVNIVHEKYVRLRVLVQDQLD
jgi:hypothetical protein